MVQTNSTELWKMAAAARAKAARVKACAEEQHLWRRYQPPGAIVGPAPIVLFLICDTCGRTPQEALDALVAKPKPVLVEETPETAEPEPQPRARGARTAVADG